MLLLLLLQLLLLLLLLFFSTAAASTSGTSVVFYARRHDGCQVKMRLPDLLDHEPTCLQRPLPCLHSGCAHPPVAVLDIVEHIRVRHRWCPPALLTDRATHVTFRCLFFCGAADSSGRGKRCSCCCCCCCWGTIFKCPMYSFLRCEKQKRFSFFLKVFLFSHPFSKKIP